MCEAASSRYRQPAPRRAASAYRSKLAFGQPTQRMYVRGTVSARGFRRRTGSRKCPNGVGARRASIHRRSAWSLILQDSRAKVSHGAGAKRGRKEPTVALGLHELLHHGSPLRRDDVQHGLTVLRHESVEVHELPDALRNAIDDASDHDPARAVAHKDDVVKVLVRQEVDHVVDVGIEADLGTSQMDTLAESGQGGRVNGVSSRV